MPGPEAAPAARTLLDVVRLSTSYLAEHGSASARLDTELLCAHALHLRRLDVYLQFERVLSGEELGVIRELVRRRGGGEPVAYITGEREFYGRTFEVTPAVLIPRPDTETLLEGALRLIRARGADTAWRVADLGTGSGCVAVTLAAEWPALQVIATDRSQAALAVAQRNAERHRVADRVQLRETSWADGIDEQFDIIVSNPPYVTTDELAHTDRDVREHEPRTALDGGADGLDAYRELLSSLERRVKPPDWLLLEVDPRRAVAVTELVGATFPACMCRTIPDLAGRARVVEASPP